MLNLIRIEFTNTNKWECKNNKKRERAEFPNVRYIWPGNPKKMPTYKPQNTAKNMVEILFHYKWEAIHHAAEQHLDMPPTPWMWIFIDNAVQSKP